MFESLKEAESRFEEIGVRLSDPATVQDQETFQRLMRERAKMEPVIETYREYQSCLQNKEDMEAMLKEEADPEMVQMAKEELKEETEKEKELEYRLKRLMIPEDEDDERNIFMEIRAGVGGEESALFSADLFRMYTRYAERRGWSTRVASFSESDLGGYKEIVFQLKGNGVYGRMKFESGVHVVKRVPVTESGGRLHTSTVTVAVLPEAKDVEVNIDPGDLRIDVYRSSGHGGQSVNTTDSAVRVTHIPTGTVVICQDEKSQLKNRDAAIRELKSRLLVAERARQHQEIADDRRSQVGGAMRSEKVRTYHFQQCRVSDHRLEGYTSHRVNEIIDGDLDELIDRLIEQEQEAKLADMGLL